jgi:hypothetical protein
MVYLRFAFEDGAETLEYMAQSMRRKLDLVRVKIGLKGWQAMTRAERLALSHFSVDTDDERAAFVQVLRGFAERAGAKVETVAAVDARAWGKERVPDAVRARRDISLDAWAALSDEERYVLLRLAEHQRMPQRFDAALAQLLGR